MVEKDDISDPKQRYILEWFKDKPPEYLIIRFLSTVGRGQCGSTSSRDYTGYLNSAKVLELHQVKEH
ncbi:hypothetical protein BGZ65_000822, partial [Modicella reniformis]